jgi:hypothetical protein
MTNSLDPIYRYKNHLYLVCQQNFFTCLPGDTIRYKLSVPDSGKQNMNMFEFTQKSFEAIFTNYAAQEP